MISERDREILQNATARCSMGVAPDHLIKCEELWKLMNESEEYILLVDVRSDVETNVSRIKGAITYAEYLGRNDIDSIPFVKTIFYSTIGRRSGEICKTYIEKGISAYSLEGGLIMWCNYEKGELVDRNGAETHLIHVFDPDYRPLFNSSFICVY